MVENVIHELTAEEAELYDRQIRLWGLENQKKLRNSRILLAGLNGLGAEIAKNIILAGLKSVTFLDNAKVSKLDFASQFFIPTTEEGKFRAEVSLLRAQALNPMVELTADTGNLSDKDEEFFKKFDVIVITEASIAEQIRIDNICRQNKIKFFAADMWGMFGFSFADLQEHEFAEDIIKHKVISKPHEKVKTEPVKHTTKRTLNFPSLESTINFDFKSQYFAKRMKKTGPAYIVMKILQKFREDENRDPLPAHRDEDIKKLLTIRDSMADANLIPDIYFEHVFGQISPSSAILGGAVAQEVIKTVSQKDAPHYNYFFFDPQTACGFIETIET
ncbi:SUMO-activating enzyme subunit 1 [Chironomus tepperi]|uniref:SUMO-activating enzyme subunit 1 n=1 Tax=Chironomus tepperi TaxID=113505 RepID=UPI00391F178A